MAFRFYILGFPKYRRCFRSRLVFRHCPQTWQSRQPSHRFDSLHTRPLPHSRTLRIHCHPPPKKTVEIGLGLCNERVSNYFDYFTCICLDNPIFRQFGSLTLNLYLQNLSNSPSSSSSTWTTRNAPWSHSPHLMIMSSLSTTNPLNSVDNGLAATERLSKFSAF